MMKGIGHRTAARWRQALLNVIGSRLNRRAGFQALGAYAAFSLHRLFGLAGEVEARHPGSVYPQRKNRKKHRKRKRQPACRNVGQSCTEDRDCCSSGGQSTPCLSGACQTVPPSPSPPPPPPPPPVLDCGAALLASGCSHTANAGWNCDYATGLRNRNLTRCDLANASFISADFNGANLGFADMSHSDARYANFSRANLSRVNMTGTNLTSATIAISTNVTGVIWNNTICPNGVNSDTTNHTCAGQFSAPG